MTKQKITAQRAREVVSYDPATGLFTWLVRLSNRTNIGNVAGNNNKSDGYLQIRIDGGLYRGHCLAWLIVTGSWPTSVIDHINLRRSDNRWENLREVSNAANMQNRLRANKSNKFGLLGVSACRGYAGFRAQITTDGKNRYIGSYGSPKEAHSAYLEAKRTQHQGCYFDQRGAEDSQYIVMGVAA